MNLKKKLFAVICPFFAVSAFGSGFALYEPSTVSHAMGGALIGRAMDASANFNNPATLTDLTNIWVTAGFITEHPRAQARGTVNGYPWRGADQNCDAGLFWLPHFQLAIPLPEGFTFGLSAAPEYGLGTKYDDGWAMDWSSNDTLVQGYVINPNLAYKVTDKWSIATGLRWLYFDFEQYKAPLDPYTRRPMNYRLRGDNRWESVGWTIGTKYDILDNLSVGLVYKSQIDTDIRGKTSATPTTSSPYNVATARALNGDADAKMRLPQSITAGINWDVAPEHHLGLALSWTQWSQFDWLYFNVKPQLNPIYLDWNDTWRASIGYAWDFHADWTWMISYVFDQDCCLENDQTSAMLPPAHRNIATTGFRWNVWRNMDLVLDYSCIFMDGGSFDTTNTTTGERYHFETCRGFCHAVGFSVSYRF